MNQKPITLNQIRNFKPEPHSLVVLRLNKKPPVSEMQAIAKDLKDHGIPQTVLFVFLEKGEDIQNLPELEMNRFGWFKKQEYEPLEDGIRILDLT